MHRVLAALVAALALAAAGVPVAAAMPPHCAECCRHGIVHASDAPMPDCCRVAPTEPAVNREEATPRLVTTAAAVNASAVRPQPAPVPARLASGAALRLARIEILRI